jgi:hypothetical protein
MRRFDLLDEYTCVAVPRFSPARTREPEHREAEDRPHSAGTWRYGVAGVVAIVLVALIAL